MAKFKAPSAAVLKARAARAARSQDSDKNDKWFIREVSDKISMSMKQRTQLAAEFLKSKVVKNISRPVTKGHGPRGGRLITDRSKPGEYPKADTTQLMKSIFSDVRETKKGRWDGYVGTPLDYGAILELSQRLDRSYIRRTLDEERDNIKRILTGPIR